MAKYFRIRAGLRMSFYSKEEDDEDSKDADTPAFQYGNRLRFHTKLFAPHNFGNPGAFDYRAYLADNGIAALGSAKVSSCGTSTRFSAEAKSNFTEHICIGES